MPKLALKEGRKVGAPVHMTATDSWYPASKDPAVGLWAPRQPSRPRAVARDTQQWAPLPYILTPGAQGPGNDLNKCPRWWLVCKG